VASASKGSDDFAAINETTQFGAATMKALSLFAVCVLAKVLVLAGREITLSWWSPLAYLWQDALIASIFGIVEFFSRGRPWLTWFSYGGIVLYVAINVPLMRILSSPLTWQMSRAAGTALSDSIRHYLTLENLAFIMVVLSAGFVLPFCLRNVSRRAVAAMSMAAIILIALGPTASARVDSIGLHRNAVMALLRSFFPRIAAVDIALEWRAGLFERNQGEDLSAYRGTATNRNILLILLESTGASYLRPYGSSNDPMPNLTKLVETSLLFENAYAVYPESIKGLFSVLCSRYPAFDTRPTDYERVSTASIAKVLSRSGYHTGLFHSGRFMYLGMNSIIQDRGYEILEDAGSISGNFNSSFGVDEPATVKRMLEWLDSLPAGEKFLLTYLPIAGHHPYSTPGPGPFGDRSEQEQYLNALHYGDAALGQLFQGLKSRGLDTNTLFLIFGDHGEAFGQHEGNYGHTLFIHEENVRVPYLIAAPGLIREPKRISRVASLIDTAPTILDLLGVSWPCDYQGSSLLRAAPEMALFYTDYSLGFVGLRDGDWKFIYELESKRSKLFHLDRDKREVDSLAAGYPQRTARYREHLLRWSGAQKELLLHPRGEMF
jgi:glucan phosphoethanolaminetransferase (alkaline phosphatase superfamily)